MIFRIEMTANRKIAIAIKQCAVAVSNLAGTDIQPRSGSDHWCCITGGAISSITDIVHYDVRVKCDMVTVDAASAKIFYRRAI